MVFVTSDSPSWTHVFQITGKANKIEKIVRKYPFPFELGICFRCLEKDSGWKSKSRLSNKYNTLGFDIVVYEEDFISIKKNIDAQKKILGKEFHEYFFNCMRKYEKKFPIL